jgi:xanthine dehydrogenase accessory factor
VMSHDYERDRVQVRALLAADVAYVGVLGPRRRTQRMIDDLDVSEADAARLYAPVGLDIGAETPDEIALAIVAEVQAVKAGRRGASLRDRAGAIHEESPMTPAGGLSERAVTPCVR